MFSTEFLNWDKKLKIIDFLMKENLEKSGQVNERSMDMVGLGAKLNFLDYPNWG